MYRKDEFFIFINMVSIYSLQLLKMCKNKYHRRKYRKSLQSLEYILHFTKYIFFQKIENLLIVLTFLKSGFHLNKNINNFLFRECDDTEISKNVCNIHFMFLIVLKKKKWNFQLSCILFIVRSLYFMLFVSNLLCFLYTL